MRRQASLFALGALLGLASIAQAQTTPVITVGQTVNGRLLTSTPGRAGACSGCYADFYQFTVNSSQTLTITLTSAEFDTVLTVRDASGATVAENDDESGTTTNSRVTRVFAPGTYRIEVTSYSPAETGAYALMLAAAAASPAPSISSITPAIPTALTTSQTVTLTGANFQSPVDVFIEWPQGPGVTGSVTSVSASTIVMSLNFNGIAGAYTIKVTNPDGRVSNVFPFTVVPVSGAPAVISVGQTVTGTLSSATPNRSLGCASCFADVYQLTLTSAQVLTVTLTSTTFDSFVRVLDSAGATVAEDNDSGGNQNSRISRSFAAGTYRIEATTYRAGMTGSYTLSLRAGSFEQPPPFVSSISPGSPLGSASSQDIRVNGSGFQAGLVVTLFNSSGSLVGTFRDTSIQGLTGASFVVSINFGGAAGGYSLRVTNSDAQASNFFSFTVQSAGGGAPPSAISVGQTLSGTLTTATPNRSVICRDCFADLYQLTLASPQTLTISLNSSTFDAFLRVYDAAGALVVDDDDGGDGTNARIVRSFVAGTYRIEASTYSRDETGPYTLSIQAGTGGVAVPAITSLSPATPQALTAAQSIRVNGTNFETGLTVLLTRPSGTTTLSGGEITGVGPTAFMMSVNLNGVAGAYTVRVTNPNGQQSNVFSFTAQAVVTAPPTPYTIGQTVNGTLSTSTVNRSSGCPGCFADLYQFTLTSTQTLSFSLTSTAFDAFLRVLDSSGTAVVFDDDGGGGTDSRILRSFPAGTYRVEATTYSEGQVGAYRLSISAVAANQPPPAISATSPSNLLSTLSLQNVTVTGSSFQTGLVVTVTAPGGTGPLTVPASRITSLTPTSFVMALNFNGAAGNYSVRVTNPDGQQSNAFGFAVLSTGGVGQPSAINIGQTITGALNAATVNRSVRCTGCLADLYQFTLTTTQTLAITLNSASLDAYLVVLNAAGVTVAEDDDNGGDTNSRISRSFTPGTYRIEATTYAGGQTGAYTLSLQVGGGSQAAPVINSISPASPLALIGNQNIRVNGSDFQGGLTVTLGGAGSATIGGAQIQNVTATSFVAVVNLNGVAGGYTLRVNNPDGQPSNPFGFTAQAVTVGAPTVVSLGQTVNGTLSAATPGRSLGCSGCYADRYEFTIGAEQALTISMSSTAFDAFLRVLDAAGAVVATDDDGGGALNAAISRIFAAGTYRVEATTYSPATGGAYTFALQGGATAQPPPFISSIDPASPPPAFGNQTLRVAGGNFQPGLRAVLTGPGGSTTVPVLGVAPGSFNVVVNFNGVAGGYQIRATNPDGQQSDAFGFGVTGVTTAAIDSINPASPFASDGNQNVAVFGRNFQSGLTATLSAPDGREIVLQGSEIRNLTAATFVLVVNFANLGGRWELRVSNPDGQVSNRLAFTVRPPVIVCAYSVSPARQLVRGEAGSGQAGVVTNTGCRYNVQSNATFLTVTSGASLSGSGTVTYTVAANASTETRTGTIAIADQTLTVTQSGTAPVLLVSPGTLAFRFRRGGTRPDSQAISVFSNGPSIGFTARATTATGGAWLSTGQPGGASPASLNISVNPDILAPGHYEGTVTIDAAAANPPSRAVAVTFDVEEPPPQLGVEPRSITLTLPKSAATRVETLVVTNTGGGFLPFRARVTMLSGDNWLSVNPEIGSAGAGASAAVMVTADARGLAVGTYRGQVAIASSASGETINVPVTIIVNEIQQNILLSQTGLTFIAVSRGGTPPAQNFGVLNDGEGVMDWTVTASALSGNWLSVTQRSGRTDAASLVVPLVDARIDPTGLPEGDYYGQIAVSSPTARNSPQFISVVLSVLPPGSDPGPVLQPTGLIFAGIAGGANPAAQSFSVSNLTDTAKTLTFNPGFNPSKPVWFATDTTEATIRKDQPAIVTVRPSTTGMEAGIRRGSLTLLPTDESPITVVALLLVLIPRAPTPGAAVHSADESCTPTELYPVFTSLGTRFQVSAAWPYTVQVRVVDNCGNPLTAGSVVANFSNNDPALSLVSLKDGRWSGTWQGRNVRGADVTITVTAESVGKGIRGFGRLVGGLAANANPPVVATDGVTNLSPGTIASISGQRLAESTANAGPLPSPLPFQLGGSTVTLGGRPLPLFAANADRLDVLVPYDIDGNTRHQLVVRRGNSYAVPEPVTVSSAQPVIHTRDGSGRGQGSIQVIPDAAAPYLAEPGTPAEAGNRIIISCGGLGAVSPAVAPEMPAPETPISETVNPITLTIGGINAQVESTRLAPGAVGVYWITAIVPGGVTPGDAVEVVASVASQTSAPVTMAVK